jgi:hypothetical protein
MAAAGTDDGSGADGRSSAMATPQANRQRDKAIAANFIQIPLAAQIQSESPENAALSRYSVQQTLFALTLEWNTLHALVGCLFAAR